MYCITVQDLLAVLQGFVNATEPGADPGPPPLFFEGPSNFIKRGKKRRERNGPHFST